MDSRQIGIVYNELRHRRVLFSEVAPGRRRTESELAAIRILSTAGGRLSDLEDFLSTQGLRLLVCDVEKYGLPGKGLLYAVVRDPTSTPPVHLKGGEILRAIGGDNRREDVTEVIAIRATFFMLVLLYLLYTRDKRPIEAVSEFKNTSVDAEEFRVEAQRQIQVLRAAPDRERTSRRDAVREAILQMSDKQLDSRAEPFLSAMARRGMLEKIESVSLNVDGQSHPVYRQTLWSALEIAENFRRYAPHFLLEDVAEDVETIGTVANEPDLPETAREKAVDGEADVMDAAEEE